MVCYLHLLGSLNRSGGNVIAVIPHPACGSLWSSGDPRLCTVPWGIPHKGLSLTGNRSVEMARQKVNVPGRGLRPSLTCSTTLCCDQPCARYCGSSEAEPSGRSGNLCGMFADVSKPLLRAPRQSGAFLPGFSPSPLSLCSGEEECWAFTLVTIISCFHGVEMV